MSADQQATVIQRTPELDAVILALLPEDAAKAMRGGDLVELAERVRHRLVTAGWRFDHSEASRRRTTGGYPSSDRPATDLRRPPRGPAPGAGA